MRTLWLVQRQIQQPESECVKWMGCELPMLGIDRLLKARRLLAKLRKVKTGEKPLVTRLGVDIDLPIVWVPGGRPRAGEESALERHVWSLSANQPTWLWRQVGGVGVCYSATVVIEEPWFYFTHRNGLLTNLIEWEAFLSEYRRKNT